jgi:hypothetical protein
VLSRQLGTQKKTGRNHDVGALERGPSSRLGTQSWVTVQNVFSQSDLVFSEFPVVLNSMKSEISLFRVSSCFERDRGHAGLTAWPMLNVYPFKLGKETLKPRLGPQSSDCFAMLAVRH